MKENNSVCHLIVSHSSPGRDDTQPPEFSFWNSTLVKDVGTLYDIVCTRKPQNLTSTTSAINDDYWWDILNKRWMILLVVSRA